MVQSQATILVVENEASLRFDICQHLLECGFTVLESETAREAIRLMVLYHDIDILFVEAALPGRSDGLDLARWTLRQYPHIAVILTSGDKSRSGAMRALCGENSFEKPYVAAAVSARMRAILEAKHAGGKDG